MTRQRYDAEFGERRFSARFGGVAPLVAGEAFARTIDGSTQRTWNTSGDVRTYDANP